MDESVEGGMKRLKKARLLAKEAEDALRNDLKQAVKDKRIASKEAGVVQRLIDKE